MFTYKLNEKNKFSLFIEQSIIKFIEKISKFVFFV